MDKPPLAYTILENGWILKVQPPVHPESNRVLLMLHGWTGNETVMSVFGQKTTADYWQISPRGIVKTSTSGYGWLPTDSIRRHKYFDCVPVIDELDRQLSHWLTYLKIPAKTVDLMGFSQGGAVVLTYLIHKPERIGRAACLAGFLPDGAEKYFDRTKLTGKKVMIAHGTDDETVPIDMAAQSASLFESAGAEVVFCRDKVGHKLGPTCFKGLETFFA